MQNSIDIGWLEIGIREDASLAVLHRDRLEKVVNELLNAETQHPSLCCFLGGKTKDYALQQLYPLNNIRRHFSDAQIRLRYDIGSLGSQQPVLLADGDIPDLRLFTPRNKLPPGQGSPVSWGNKSAGEMLVALWSRLVFCFTDVVCIFIDDDYSLRKAMRFLVDCLEFGSASPLLTSLLPRAIFIYSTASLGKRHHDIFEKIVGKSQSEDLSRIFSNITAMSMSDTLDADVSDTTRFLNLKALIKEQVNILSAIRQEKHSRPNGKHFLGLFQSAVHHILDDIENPFNMVKAIRKHRPVSMGVSSCLRHYLQAAYRAHLQVHQLAPSIASALFMDHYVPDIYATSPKAVFQTLYKSIVIQAYHSFEGLWLDTNPSDQALLVQLHFCDLFKSYMERKSSVDIRKEQVTSQNSLLCRLHSNHICLYCLMNAAQHILACGHTLCDRCVQVFGNPTVGSEYQFTIKGCLYCCYQRPLIVDILPPTASPTILAIDGGGVRGGYPARVFDPDARTSGPMRDSRCSGLISLGLFSMSWSIAECSKRFETLARQIFQERRPSLLLRRIAGSKSLFGQMARWLQWLLHDSCYDSRIFDSALKGAFGNERLIFGACTREDPQGPRRSGPRVGVVTTSISRDTATFVTSARATAAAPFFFTPVDLHGIGSFQDGGLKYNFAGEIASQISHQIWPQAMGSTRLVSLGTGKADSRDQTPHFRHIFRDSFLRRGFDAWMSTMDTDSDWRKWRARLSQSFRGDCYRLDVPLGDSPHTIDAIEKIEDYRNLVILQVGSTRMAREAATSLLISQFFFVIETLPGNTATPFWCHGSVHCRGPATKVVKALEALYPSGLSFFSDCGSIDSFRGPNSLCAICGRYSQSISFLAQHQDFIVNIYIQAPSKMRWRIGGFPESVAGFVSKQGFNLPFGRDDHGYPCRQACHNCDFTGSPMRGKRRRRESRASGPVGDRKRALFLYFTMGGPDKERNSRNRLIKRCKTLKAKATQLSILCNANVYLFVNHERGSFVYNSVNDGSWPPSDKMLDSHYPNLDRGVLSRKEKSPESSIRELKRLTRYFAIRHQLLSSLGDFYNGANLAHEITQKGDSALMPIGPPATQDVDAQG
ncbi:hypothetical protein N7454_003237 [Penicillium verhagenii]|nr:hypothetical protein N7454_003237 [Penicillium verhagenii]